MTTAEGIAKEVKKTLLRYRSGMISQDQSRHELAILITMLKAYEDIVLEHKIDRIEAILKGRQ